MILLSKYLYYGLAVDYYQNLKIRTHMRKLTKLILIILLVSVAIAILFTFPNFLPRNVTESVTVITTDQSGCVVQTYDKFILKIKSCNARPG